MQISVGPAEAVEFVHAEDVAGAGSFDGVLASTKSHVPAVDALVDIDVFSGYAGFDEKVDIDRGVLLGRAASRVADFHAAPTC